MAQTFARILLLISLSGAFAKYVYIKDEKSWYEAQTYCRLHHTDLAPISNEDDIKQLRQLANKIRSKAWIGLQRESTEEQWMWSGGGAVSKYFWHSDQPKGKNFAFIRGSTWHAAKEDNKLSFFCYNAIVVKEAKTWEKALDYCREHHSDLASVGSEIEMLLIQEMLIKNQNTNHAWIGLHFFSGYWLWVDRMPLNYEGWVGEGKPECPHFKLECVALLVMGGGHTGTVSGSNSSGLTGYSLATSSSVGSIEIETAIDFDRNISKSARAAKVSEWKAHNCEEKLSFVCY